MDLLQALILGIVQGITEFFPVSSSAHLKFCRFLMNLPEGNQWLYFDLACHAGTWIALAIYLRSEILSVLTSLHKMTLFTIALVPLVPAYFLLKPLRESLSTPSYTGYFLLATALLLFLAAQSRPTIAQPSFSAPLCDKINPHKPPPILSLPVKYKDVLFIGVMQAMALLPGLSRSGSTISAAKFCGWNWVDGAKFSFLLAIPTILGGEILESYKAFKVGTESVQFGMCGVGFIASLFVGLLAVRFVFRIYERENVRPFAWYCLGFGMLLIAVFSG